MVLKNCSVSHNLQNIFLCVQQNKDIHTGLELLEDECDDRIFMFGSTILLMGVRSLPMSKANLRPYIRMFKFYFFIFILQISVEILQCVLTLYYVMLGLYHKPNK